MIHTGTAVVAQPTGAAIILVPRPALRSRTANKYNHKTLLIWMIATAMKLSEEYHGAARIRTVLDLASNIYSTDCLSVHIDERSMVRNCRMGIRTDPPSHYPHPCDLLLFPLPPWRAPPGGVVLCSC